MRSLFATFVMLSLVAPALAVDGVLEINQTCAVQTGCFAGDAPGYPVTITAPGSYALTGNLLAAGPADGVEILASNVLLDLNGFSLDVVLDGARVIIGSGTRVTVQNGTLRGGLALGGAGFRLERVRYSSMWVAGTSFGRDCAIESSAITIGQQPGKLGDNCRVANSQFTGGAEGNGLEAGEGVQIVSSHFNMQASGATLRCDGNCVIKDSVFRNLRDGDACTSCGAIRAPNSVVQGNTFENTGVEFVLFAPGSLVRDNVFISRGSSAYLIYADNAVIASNVVDGGILSPPSVCIKAASSTVIGNVIRGCGKGLEADSTTGYKDNQFSNNTTDVVGGIEIGQNVCGGDTTCP